MSDMAQVIIPKSDQLNADDLIAGPITVTITDVTIRGGQEQPISIHFEGDNGKPYKPCKSMCRVMVTAWGADSKKYIGRSMTLYRDPTVKWAGMEVGGIRISHMSDIDSKITMALTMTRANKKPYTVRPLESGATKGAVSQLAESTVVNREGAGSSPAGTATITPDQVAEIEAWATTLGAVKKFKTHFKVERFSQILADDYLDCKTWLQNVQDYLNKAAI